MTTMIYYCQFALPMAMGAILLSSLYWFGVKPVLARAIRFSLFAKRDRLRRLAIDGKVSPESLPYRYLEERICFGIAEVPKASLFRFLPFLRNKGEHKPNFETERFEKQASDELKELYAGAVHSMLLVVLLNSPLLSAFIILVAVGMIFTCVVENLQAKVIERFQVFLDNAVFYPTRATQ